MRLAGKSSLPSLLASRPLVGPRRRTAAIKPAHQRHVGCHAAVDLAKFANKSYLDKAAQRFKIGRAEEIQPVAAGTWFSLMCMHVAMQSRLPATYAST